MSILPFMADFDKNSRPTELNSAGRLFLYLWKKDYFTMMR